MEKNCGVYTAEKDVHSDYTEDRYFLLRLICIVN